MKPTSAAVRSLINMTFVRLEETAVNGKAKFVADRVGSARHDFRMAIDEGVRRRVKTYPSTPRRFNPATASAAELARHGLPQRPDPQTNPQGALLWKRAFGRPMRFVEAKLAPAPAKSRLTHTALPGPVQPGPQGLAPADSTYANIGANWAGAVRTVAAGSDYSDPATMVFASWVVPEVAVLGPAGETMSVGFWVGLDGSPLVSDPIAANQVLQAGVKADVYTGGWWPWDNGHVDWWAFGEWYAQVPEADQNGILPQQIKNLPVQPGDTIVAVVCAAEPDLGVITVANLTRGRGASLAIPAPPGYVSRGQSAEWVVEVPLQSPNIPYFAPVTFTDCTAGSLQDGVFHLEGVNVVEIESKVTPPKSGPYPSPPVDYTQTSIASATTVVVVEIGTDWS
jgi:hypothetical protein